MDIAVIQSIFLKYLLLPLVVLVLALVLRYLKKKTPTVKAKTLIVYILLAALCLALPGFLGVTGNTFSPYGYLCSMLVYLPLGILNVNLQQQYFKAADKPLWYAILFESIITLTCMLAGGYLFVLIFNWMSPYPGYAVMAATSIFIYIVPLSFYYCYLQFISIPFDIYKTWSHAPGQAAVDFDKITYRELLVLNLELTKTPYEGKRFSINAKAPSDGASFGDWFFRVADDYNYKNPDHTIHLYDSDMEPFYWIFYTKRSIFHRRRIIDFDETIAHNRLGENSIIICKRVVEHEQEGGGLYADIKHKNETI